MTTVAPIKGKLTDATHIPLPARIDKALVHMFPNFSRRAIRRYLDVGSVYLNRKRVRVASRQVYSGDELEIIPIAIPVITKVAMPMPLYEDESVVVVNKPPHLATQATRTQAVSHLTALLQNQYGQNLRLVHRLDQETSGVIVYAKNQAVASFLAQQFQAKLVKKTYLALVHGVPNWHELTHSSYLTPIRKSIGIVQEFSKQSKQTKLAVTKFTLIACSQSVAQSVALVKCEPLTGRSHQIRVHLYGLGLPIVGDKKYGDVRPNSTSFNSSASFASSDRHLLHAYHLMFKHPQRQVSVHAPLPADFCVQLQQHLQMPSEESVENQVAALAQVSVDSPLQSSPQPSP